MRSAIQFSRVALFIIYFWFGFLKVIGVSPAEVLVEHLYLLTIKLLVDFRIFFVFFGVLECVIGLLWLVPKWTKWSLYLMILHLCLTVLPIVVLPHDTWADYFTPTLVGQYIIKNLVLLSSALVIYKSNTEQA